MFKYYQKIACLSCTIDSRNDTFNAMQLKMSHAQFTVTVNCYLLLQAISSNQNIVHCDKYAFKFLSMLIHVHAQVMRCTTTMGFTLYLFCTLYIILYEAVYYIILSSYICCSLSKSVLDEIIRIQLQC